MIESFDGFVLFEVFKDNKLLKYVLICAMTIEIIIFVFFIIVDAETMNLLKIVNETLDWLLLAIESILWKCVVKIRVIFLSRQTFLINQKHILTLLYTRNTARKTTSEKTHPLHPPSHTLLIIINYKEHIMKMCRQGSNNFPFSTNLSYQLKTHFNTLICSKYNSKNNKWKNTPPLSPSSSLPPFFIPLIRDEYRITRIKEWKRSSFLKAPIFD